MLAVAAPCLVVAIALGLLVALSPGRRADKPGLWALVALGLAALSGAFADLPDLGWTGLPLGVAALFLVPAIVIGRAFGRIDMIALLFHQDFGLQGSTLAAFKNEIVVAFLSVLVILVAWCGLLAVWQLPGEANLAAAAVLAMCNPVLPHAAMRLVRRPAPSLLAQRLAPVRLTGPAPCDPDLIMVYLEGTDRRFADTSAYGAVYAPLGRYAAEGLSLTGIRQIAGTGWSLAGMVASQSGLPILPRGLLSDRKAECVNRFMPGFQFLGDVLATRGYASHFVVGGDIRFGGIGAMYATHQIGGITGLAELQQAATAESMAAATLDGIADDQMVLDAARRIHRDLARQDRPLALIVETFGPHGPKGHLSRRWSPDDRATKTPSIGLAVGCLLIEVAEFLDDIRASQPARGRPLRIVLLSDHLNHNPRIPAGSTSFAGCNTAILWGDAGTSGRVIDRPGSMVDMFPTILDWLGWSPAPVSAGLGRSLLSDRPTLVEEFGTDAVDAMLRTDARLGRMIWADDGQLAERPVTA